VLAHAPISPAGVGVVHASVRATLGKMGDTLLEEGDVGLQFLLEGFGND
jgi:hypothetical protein